jgi:DNA-binding PadR family transcriptional regulator
MNVQDQIPLQETTFFILLSLSRQPRHGYAILQDVAQLSNGRLQLSTGTLYGALRRMLDLAWIERYDAATETVNGRIRKAYRITELGQKILNADVARMQDMITAVQGKPA